MLLDVSFLPGGLGETVILVAPVYIINGLSSCGEIHFDVSVIYTIPCFMKWKRAICYHLLMSACNM